MAKSIRSTASDDAAKVKDYMDQLDHPLKAEIEALRKLIKEAGPMLSERIKWNAPSYYYKVDLLTFNHRMRDKVHLIFHNEAIVRIKSDLLEGDYKDRRMMYFPDMKAVKANKKELERIIGAYLRLIDEQTHVAE
jgi:uncharacterized protein YdhG (YjbR/CyaY superfamily)